MPPPTPEPDAPYYTRRVYKRWSLGGLLGAAAVMGSTWITPGWAAGWRLAVVAAAILLGLALLIGWERRTVRRLEAAGYRLCPRCAYPLTGHTGDVACPECGGECNVEAVQRAWRGFRPRLSGALRR